MRPIFSTKNPADLLQIWFAEDVLNYELLSDQVVALNSLWQKKQRKLAALFSLAYEDKELNIPGKVW